jgi:restriction system protein
MSEKKLPRFDAFFTPLLNALKMLGGSGTIEEINSKVAQLVGLSDNQLEIMHDSNRGGRTEFEYRLAWTRTYLRIFGLIENSSRGVWAITAAGRNIQNVDEKEVVKSVREQMRARHSEYSDEQDESLELSWEDDLLKTLLKMDPSAFERLVQRMLRESGFIQVEVTGRSGDGGVDGRGIMRLGGLLSFHVILVLW